MFNEISRRVSCDALASAMQAAKSLQRPLPCRLQNGSENNRKVNCNAQEVAMPDAKQSLWQLQIASESNRLIRGNALEITCQMQKQARCQLRIVSNINRYASRKDRGIAMPDAKALILSVAQCKSELSPGQLHFILCCRKLKIRLHM